MIEVMDANSPTTRTVVVHPTTGVIALIVEVLLVAPKFAMLSNVVNVTAVALANSVTKMMVLTPASIVRVVVIAMVVTEVSAMHSNVVNVIVVMVAVSLIPAVVVDVIVNHVLEVLVKSVTNSKKVNAPTEMTAASPMTWNKQHRSLSSSLPLSTFYQLCLKP